MCPVTWPKTLVSGQRRYRKFSGVSGCEAYMEIFQGNNPNTDLIRQEFRPHGPWQVTT
jgi:hypothetical protein